MKPDRPSRTAAPRPGGARVILLLGGVVGLGLAGGSGWMLLGRIDPIGGPAWAFWVVAASLIIAPALMLLSAIALSRHPKDKMVARAALAANASALLLGAAALVRVG